MGCSAGDRPGIGKEQGSEQGSLPGHCGLVPAEGTPSCSPASALLCPSPLWCWAWAEAASSAQHQTLAPAVLWWSLVGSGARLGLSWEGARVCGDSGTFR